MEKEWNALPMEIPIREIIKAVSLPVMVNITGLLAASLRAISSPVSETGKACGRRVPEGAINMKESTWTTRRKDTGYLCGLMVESTRGISSTTCVKDSAK